jgi:hypothetical protein
VEAQELKDIEKKIKFDGNSFAICLGVDYDQLRKFKCGQTAIPDEVARAARELEHIERVFDQQRISAYDAFMSTQPSFLSEAISEM